MFFGSLLGAVLTCLAGAALAVLIRQPAMMIFAVPVFPFVLLVWFVGLVAVAGPGWWLLHRLGARCQQAAMIYGGGLTFVVIAGLGPLYTSSEVDLSERWRMILHTAGVFALIGLIVGWVVAKVAYEPAKT